MNFNVKKSPSKSKRGKTDWSKAHQEASTISLINREEVTEDGKTDGGEDLKKAMNPPPLMGGKKHAEASKVREGKDDIRGMG